MDFFVLIEKKTCSLCIGTFGANIVIMDVVNFIVAVTFTKLVPRLSTSRDVGDMFGMRSQACRAARGCVMREGIVDRGFMGSLLF